MAAAGKGRADVIVTNNVKDFPPDRLPDDLLVQTADDFRLDALDLGPDAMSSAVAAVSARTGRTGPKLSVDDVTEALKRSGAVRFVEELRRRMQETV